jgi:hypothetical protein
LAERWCRRNGRAIAGLGVLWRLTCGQGLIEASSAADEPSAYQPSIAQAGRP